MRGLKKKKDINILNNKCIKNILKEIKYKNLGRLFFRGPGAPSAPQHPRDHSGFDRHLSQSRAAALIRGDVH